MPMLNFAAVKQLQPTVCICVYGYLMLVKRGRMLNWNTSAGTNTFKLTDVHYFNVIPLFCKCNVAV